MVGWHKIRRNVTFAPSAFLEVVEVAAEICYILYQSFTIPTSHVAYQTLEREIKLQHLLM